MDLQSIIQMWRDHVAQQPEVAHTFDSAITSPCPARAVAEAESQLSTNKTSARLMQRAQIRYTDKMRGYLAKSVPGVFRGEKLSLRGLRLRYLGSYAGKNVVLALLPAGQYPKDYVSNWALRWELAGIAALTHREEFVLMVTGQASQKNFEQYEVRIDPDPSALVEAILPTAVAGRHCKSCPFEAHCPKGDRAAPGTAVLGTPPFFEQLKADQKKSGRSLLSKSLTLKQRLWRTLYEADPERKPGYHPSTIGKEIEKEVPCLRVFFYQASGLPQDPAWNWLEWVFVMGHTWHEIIQELSAEADPAALVELPVKCGRIVGHQDWRREDIIIDGKTKSQGSSISEGNKGQLHCYYYAQQSEAKPPKRLAILTIQKATGALVPKEVKVDKNLLARLTTAMTEAEPYVSAQETPPRFEGADAKCSRCRSCYYRERCWREP